MICKASLPQNVPLAGEMAFFTFSGIINICLISRYGSIHKTYLQKHHATVPPGHCGFRPKGHGVGYRHVPDSGIIASWQVFPLADRDLRMSSCIGIGAATGYGAANVKPMCAWSRETRLEVPVQMQSCENGDFCGSEKISQHTSFECLLLMYLFYPFSWSKCAKWHQTGSGFALPDAMSGIILQVLTTEERMKK